METTLVLLLLPLVAVLLSSERVPIDAVAVALVVLLPTVGVLSPAEALAGFASEPVIIIGGLFVLTAGLRASGALDGLGRGVERLAVKAPRRAVVTLLVAVAAASAFMNNTTTTALFLPVALTLAQAARLAPSQLLMPLAFASILGGSITLVGTSTNVIVSGLLPGYGEAPLGLFELLPVALPVAGAGLVYLVLAGPRLLPRRQASLEQAYHIREYLSELQLEARSPLVGQTVAEAGFGRRWDLNLLAVSRRGESVPAAPRLRLEAGDRLLVEGSLDGLLEVTHGWGLELRPGPGHGGRRPPQLHLVEAVVLPRSELVGRSLAEVGFRQRYGASVVALYRHAEPLVEKLGRVALRVGDVLLIQGEEAQVERLLAQRGLLVLSQRSRRPRRRGAALVAPLVFALVLALGASGALALPGAVLLGCLLLFAGRVLTPQEAYAAIDWRLLVFIAGMLAFGKALAASGAATVLAELLLAPVAGLGPLVVLATFYLLTALLTQPMSNQAAALVVLPIALGAALEAGIDPRAMAVTVALAASASFLTPLEPSCLLVYAPGRYRFLDFPRLGAGLTLLALLLTLALVPLFWPLTP